MTPEQQLDYVERYLEPYKGKIGTLKDLYMAVLYPAAIGKSEDSVSLARTRRPPRIGRMRPRCGEQRLCDGGGCCGSRGAEHGRRGTSYWRHHRHGASPLQTDPRIAQLETKIAQRTRDAQIASLMKNESLSTRLNDDANRLTAEKNRLQERSTEIPRAVEKETALQPLKVAQQEAAAKVQREAKQYEPIGTQAADELDLPASTLWKDVPKDRKPMPRPGEGERKALSDLRSSVSGVDSLLKKLDDPKIASMVGTIFSAPPAAVERLLSEWLPTLGPEQRAFAATIAGEIMEIRHRLIGAGRQVLKSRH